MRQRKTLTPSSHGRPTPEPPRSDELSDFVPDMDAEQAGPCERGPDGRFKKGNALSSLGGRKRHAVKNHLQSLGLGWLDGDPRLAGMRRSGNSQLKAEQQYVAGSVGGGVLDPLAAAELRNAVTKETLAQLMLENPNLIRKDLASTIGLANNLLTGARGHRLAAVELASRGAVARQAQGMGTGGGPPLRVGDVDVSKELRELIAAGAPVEPRGDDSEEDGSDANK